MAKKTATRTIIKAVPMRSPTPIIKVSAPRAPSSKKKKHHGHKGPSAEKVMMGMVMGGFVLGMLDKPGGFGANLPTLPILGRAGTIGAVAYFIGKKNPQGIAMNVAKAAAAIAAYEYGSTGKVQGDADGIMSSQV